MEDIEQRKDPSGTVTSGPGRLRSGRRRIPGNSTADPAEEELRRNSLRVQILDRIQSITPETSLDFHGFEDTLIGRGIGTANIGSQMRSIRTSEDDYLNSTNINDRIQQIEVKVNSRAEIVTFISLNKKLAWKLRA